MASWNVLRAKPWQLCKWMNRPRFTSDGRAERHRDHDLHWLCWLVIMDYYLAARWGAGEGVVVRGGIRGNHTTGSGSRIRRMKTGVLGLRHIVKHWRDGIMFTPGPLSESSLRSPHQYHEASFEACPWPVSSASVVAQQLATEHLQQGVAAWTGGYKTRSAVY